MLQRKLEKWLNRENPGYRKNRGKMKVLTEMLWHQAACLKNTRDIRKKSSQIWRNTLLLKIYLKFCLKSQLGKVEICKNLSPLQIPGWLKLKISIQTSWITSRLRFWVQLENLLKQCAEPSCQTSMWSWQNP